MPSTLEQSNEMRAMNWNLPEPENVDLWERTNREDSCDAISMEEKLRATFLLLLYGSVQVMIELNTEK